MKSIAIPILLILFFVFIQQIRINNKITMLCVKNLSEENIKFCLTGWKSDIKKLCQEKEDIYYPC